MTLRRRLVLMAGGTFLATKGFAQGREGDLRVLVSDSFEQERQAVLTLATRLGLRGPVAASAGGVAPESGLDLAEVVDSALAKGADNEEAASLATRAGLLLSELNRAGRDGLEFLPGEPAAAAASVPLTLELKQSYRDDFKRASLVKGQAEIDRAVSIMLGERPMRIYARVDSETGIPWWVIASLHYREANLNFMGHLHNGDPLLLRTVNVPERRPAPPWVPPGVSDPSELWILSAKDAVRGLLHRTSDWYAVEQLCYALESYNGFGCYLNDVKSPYLWSYTDVYTGGGFPSDHHFDLHYKSKQIGLVPVMKRLAELRPEQIKLHFET